MYGGLPTQYNPHQPNTRDRRVLRTLRQGDNGVLYCDPLSHDLWEGTGREDGSQMWRYIGKYYGS